MTATSNRSVAILDRADPDFTTKFGNALTEIGFVCLYNHGISAALIRHFHGLMHKLFKIDLAYLRLWDDPRLAGQRGVRLDGESAKGSSLTDKKYFLHVGMHREEFPEYCPKDSRLLPNVWPAPDKIPELRAVMVKLYRAQYKLGIWLIGELEKYLNLEPQNLRGMLLGGDTILRGIYYPPAPAGTPWAVAHEDINLITLLVGAKLGGESLSGEPRYTGLEVCDRSGVWQRVYETPDCIMVNAGDMLQEITRHLAVQGSASVIPSTTHRVVAVEGLCDQPRTSGPMFIHPNQCRVLSRRDGRLFTAGDYLFERLAELGLLAKNPTSFAEQCTIVKHMNQFQAGIW